MKNFNATPPTKIMVPTDFSGNAEHALKYAASFASKLHCKLVLFHSNKVPIVAMNETVQLTNDEVTVRESNEHLVALKKNLSSWAQDVEVETCSAVGFAVEEILNCSKSTQSDLIIMGTKGAHGLGEILIGSNTAEVVSKAKIPVLAIPQDAKTHDIKKVLFATNYNDNDFKSIYLLTEIFKPWNPEIIIVHATDNSQPEVETNFFERFKEDVVTNIKYDKFYFNLIEGQNAEDAVSEFATHNNVDVMSVSKHKRTLFERIVTVSTTKRLAFHVHIPLLVFPEN